MPARGLGLAFLVALSSLGCARLLYNFGAVEPGRIYRTAQPSPLLLSWAQRRHGIRSIVNLRGRTPGYESAFAAEHGLRIFHLRLSASRPPSPEQVERFLEIVRDPDNQPVLVHCRAGVDRTGYMIGLYRTEALGWSPQRALHEMNRFRQFEWLNGLPQPVVRDGARSP